ncbi:Der GTPase-activating protein YihI [Saliniradius amylolyticus]|uniref:Der GTPase-activating protein YihI n=1 Tax=Saliniradius amylolyticus TaxID=2183582 RepID=A0A2S2DYP5_9ALTE|nr:Der GTPase-activating protein YihI [Saliniradius amylolyticus]AWL10524.1 Der GTPase-activating protein YihI [Saliniradius amylolyticus]
MSKTRLSKEYKRKHRQPAPKGKLSQTSSGKTKHPKGRPAGKRNAPESGAKPSGSAKTKADPRLGSKKPIPLNPTPEPKAEAPARFYSPKEELAAIENDQRLEQLLDKEEQGQSLAADEQAYMDKQLQRHAKLCQLLGIDLEAEEDSNDKNDEDLLDKLDPRHLDDFKPE